MVMNNAILFHILLVLAQPLYFLFKLIFNPNYYSTTSPKWLILSALSWLLILTRQTIPSLTSPLRRLPFLPGDVFPLGHALVVSTEQPPEETSKACQATRNNGIVAFENPLYLTTPRLILTSPEAVMEVVNTHNYDWEKPSPAKKMLRRVLGQGLVNVEGNTHKAMRKAVAPAFSGRQIRDLVPLFWSKGLDFADCVARRVRESTDSQVEIMGQMSRVTLDIIGAAGIGMDFNTIHGDDNRLAQLYSTITNTNRGSIRVFFLINVYLPRWLVRHLYGTVYAKVANATIELRKNIRELLADKKQSVKFDSAKHNDIIATIMRSGDFSEKYLCDQLLTFFAAGHDTTAAALTWTTKFLAENQTIQDRLRKECHDHLSSLTPEQVTAETFDNMPYLTAVCNETLRLYPTVPMTVRHAVVDTKIGDIRIPKGTTALISPWVVNRSPALWGRDAESYNPDRWMDGDLAASGGAKSPYALLTFLYGPRSCIGQGFARAEMKTLLAALVMRFRMEPTESSRHVKFGGIVTIKPKGGMKLKLVDLKSDGVY